MGDTPRVGSLWFANRRLVLHSTSTLWSIFFEWVDLKAIVNTCCNSSRLPTQKLLGGLKNRNKRRARGMSRACQNGIMHGTDRQPGKQNDGWWGRMKDGRSSMNR